MVVTDQEYRIKVLQPRPAMRRQDWMPVSTLDWGISSQPGVDRDQQAKLFMRWLMASVDTTLGAAGAAVQFVVLLRVESRPAALELSVICPFAAPLALIRDGDAKRDVSRAAELEIELRFGTLADIHVPVVVDCDRRAGRYAFNNLNQLNAPRQFIDPFLCRTTSGFLNFIGARDIDGASMTVMANLDALHDQARRVVPLALLHDGDRRQLRLGKVARAARRPGDVDLRLRRELTVGTGIGEIRIEHLVKDDVLDIETRAGKEDVRREEETVPVGSHGEPVLFGLALITAAALKAYIAHLKYKAAILPEEKLTHIVTVTREDGTIETHELTYEARSGEAFSDAAVRELSTVPGLEAAMGEVMS